MPSENIKTEILLNTIKADAVNEPENVVPILKIRFSKLTYAQCKDFAGIILDVLEIQKEDKVSLAVTAPPSFSIKARTAMNVVQSMINDAERNILITGYSMSSYFSDLADIIIRKSRCGVFIKIFRK